MDRYRSGATVYDLAARFSIHRNTVSQHLHRQGVAMHRQGLSLDQVDHAVHLYQAGQSLARIGARLDVDASTRPQRPRRPRSPDARHQRTRSIAHHLRATPVRVVEYTVTVRTGDGATRVESFRLVTTLLDHHVAPADALAAIYAQRWEIENGYGELKTRLRGAEFILRFKSPELVAQEVYALLTVYQALCAFEAQAATAAGIDPDRISFTVAVRIARDHVISQAAATPATLVRARAEAVADLLADLLPRRRTRECERIKKPPKNTFLTKRHDHIRPPSRVTYEIRITAKGASPAQTR